MTPAQNILRRRHKPGGKASYLGEIERLRRAGTAIEVALAETPAADAL
ncbi:hypothetical protein GGE65_004709 [Skermanella aerolata]